MKALIFDLDGTLVDTVYGHALSWQRALAVAGIATDTARLHRRIGMAGELLMEESAREAGKHLSKNQMKVTDERHAALFARLISKPRPLTGAVMLLRQLGGAASPTASRPRANSGALELQSPLFDCRRVPSSSTGRA